MPALVHFWQLNWIVANVSACLWYNITTVALPKVEYSYFFWNQRTIKQKEKKDWEMPISFLKVEKHVPWQVHASWIHLRDLFMSSVGGPRLAMFYNIIKFLMSLHNKIWTHLLNIDAPLCLLYYSWVIGICDVMHSSSMYLFTFPVPWPDIKLLLKYH